MFFKRRPPPYVTMDLSPMPKAELPEPPAPPTPPPAPTLMDRAEDVAKALQAFERTAYAAALSAPKDAREEVTAAQEKIEAATKIVCDGRLAYALLRQLVPEVRYWPAWIKRDDFEKHKSFRCEVVSAQKTNAQQNGLGGEEVAVCFIYNGTRYTVRHINRGWSSVPNSMEQIGDASLYVDNECVLTIACTLDAAKEHEHWKFSSVRSMRLSASWTKDLLQMASDIEVGGRARLMRYSDDIAVETAKNIQL